MSGPVLVAGPGELTDGRDADVYWGGHDCDYFGLRNEIEGGERMSWSDLAVKLAIISRQAP